MQRAFLTSILVLLSALGCGPAHEGRLMLVVTSDIPAPDQLRAVRVEVGDEVREITLGAGANELPFSLVVEARSGRAGGEPVTLFVSGLDADGGVLVRRPVTTTFVRGRTLVLLVDLARRCTPLAGCSGQLTCAEGEACASDGCVSPVVDATTLREVHGPGDEPAPAASYTPAAACTEYGTQFCDTILRCCPLAALLPAERAQELRAQCLRDVATFCAEDLLPLLEDPRTAFDPVRAASVLREGGELGLACDLRYADWLDAFERGLLSTMRGTVPRGALCTVEDAAGFFSCRDGACLPAGDQFRCAARACVGEPCIADVEEADYGCGDDLYCASRGDGTFACAARLADDAPCERDSQCASRICRRASPTSPRRCAFRNATNVFCPMGMDGT
jgi:hypothetical protein